MRPVGSLIVGVAVIAVAGGIVFRSCSTPSPADGSRRVLMLGVDGMDPVLLRGLLDAGRLPNFARLAAKGTFRALETSAPPQSPVAWSNVISGADPGTHQIFDFIHRDPNPPGRIVVLPYLSTSTIDPPRRDWTIPLGKWRIPLFGERLRGLRQGGAFWDGLVDHGVDTSVYRMPANYPPPDVGGSGEFQCLCGMGTPDVMGTYGEFTLLTPNAPARGRQVGGGKFVRMMTRDHRAEAEIVGPPNFLRKPGSSGAPPMTIPLEIVRDPEAAVARISVGDELVVLNEGEWSDWVPLSFETEIPGDWALSAMLLPTSMPAMVRFYLKKVHPNLEVYVTPLNIDPVRPANPIGAPSGFSRQLADVSGRYYTTGIPEDTKALRTGALTEDEFLSQVGILREERAAQYRHALSEFERGFLFFYFGHTDLLSHMFWRDRDHQHPGRKPEEAARFGNVIEDAYIEIDALLGEALDAMAEDDTIIVMSDHGFTSFRRGLNLNNWLARNGYLTLHDRPGAAKQPYLGGVDWSKTKAYALGLNGLYVNQSGREKNGIVDQSERRELLSELARGLLDLKDADGAPIVDTVYIVEQTYPGADPAIAPDIIVGYADGYRASWATTEGGFGDELIEDNLDRWSGDHCIAHELVPGIIVTNRTLRFDDPSLMDLAPTVLTEFGVTPPDSMRGRPLFESNDRSLP